MTTRTYVRWTSGALCLIIACAIAVTDYYRHREVAQLTPAPPAPPPPPVKVVEEEVEPTGPVDETLQVLKGDTLSSVLLRAKIDPTQVHDAVEALTKVFNAKDLRPDHQLFVTYMPPKEKGGDRDLLSLYIRPSIECEITVEKGDDGSYSAQKEVKKLIKTTQIAKGEIKESLFLDAKKLKVPPKVITEMVKVLSHDVDFQRDFHPGDTFGLVYDTEKDPEGLLERPGQLSFVYLKLKDKELRFYNFKPRNSPPGYYDLKGSSTRKGLLRTPVDGARLSSGFGSRRHPVLGYRKDHKGVDFAAPIGTPVMSAGDGVVEKVGPFSSYGNYIRVRHNSEISTAYAHLSRFATGLRPGKAVRQGQIIGYIGMTGRTTGPHLHYELIRFGKQVDPKHVKTMPAGKLGGADLSAFKALVASINKRFEAYKPPVQPAEEPDDADASTPTPATENDVPTSDELQKADSKKV
ncbi:MAG: peptidase M23 [Candidatus Puniceispirillum sp.]|nr:peptidase M23 [Candidatus Puniceispirillum sp.]